ncbi:unnamed protein product [Adineta steineri]|uniref:Uncharacterized protein n=1 Tax=Adineta steineri TaxID=433720 RepID=A0A816GSS7_9BILA|nr:unnamed protein product [Adineta steineri]CAF1677129.1 unnamed protein product [Adineta steineri]
MNTIKCFCLEWSITGNMTNARYEHTASVLSNGKVLVTGGLSIDYVALNSAELYDPSTSTWTTTGNMSDARFHHTASVLSNGKVLVTGGANHGTINSAELYDPSTALSCMIHQHGNWTATGNMINARGDHTVSVLSNGKVLVTGGADHSIINSAELYDPSTGDWPATGNMNNARFRHTASILSNRLVLVTGGSHRGAINSAELYDPSTGDWTTTGNMSDARFWHTSSVLSNGLILVTGGYNGKMFLNSAELYSLFQAN